MKVFKLFFFLSIVCHVGVYSAEIETAKVSKWHPQFYYHVPVNGWLGSFDVVVNSHMLPEAWFLYNLYKKAQGNPKVFVDSVMNNDQGKSLDECIEILEKNEQVLNAAGEKIDKDFSAALSLSEGLKAGAMAFGGFFALYKSTAMIKDMYWNKRFARDEVEDTYLAKIESMQPGFLKPDLFSSQKDYEEYMANVKKLRFLNITGKKNRIK